MAFRPLAIVAIGTLILAACGGGADPSADNASSTNTVEKASSPGTDETDEGAPEDAAAGQAEELADDVEETQAALGGGSATFSVGDQTWTFDSVLCAFGEDEIGQEGAEFVLSSIQDGLQMYVSVDSFGQFISLDDIEDFENPTVSISSMGSNFVTIDGKNISAQTEFIGDDPLADTTPGTFSATCP